MKYEIKTIETDRGNLSVAEAILVKVTCENGKTWTTQVRATIEEARRYFVGNMHDDYPEGPDGPEVLTRIVSVDLVESQQ